MLNYHHNYNAKIAYSQEKIQIITLRYDTKQVYLEVTVEYALHRSELRYSFFVLPARSAEVNCKNFLMLYT